MFISSLLASFCFTAHASALLLKKRQGLGTLLSSFFCTFFLKKKKKSKTIVSKIKQVVTPLSCGNEENTVSICSPSKSSVWYNNTDQEFTWNYK